MPSATYNKFQPFVDDLADGQHDFANDQFTVALTPTVPTNSWRTRSQLTGEITPYTNLSSRDLTTTSSTQTSGTYSFVIQDLVLSATGVVSDFRYIVVYNSTHASDLLVCWFDYGSTVSLDNGDSLTIEFASGPGKLFTIV